ncbi:zinc-dependent alcohol dehydrogenase family protein [Magnetospirillum aberrantis]|uniref:alcohol dehydrogenase n=1 Tax=Magnetospirillum aberrantis SpK TaxID=908842 RepID=A0A7C9UXD1_9PROT|nr:zinc-dependent alcohol dehydrogenase family protein [Magnetospirillum aberrantis SpK]
MRAMLLDAPGRPLRQAELAMPIPGPGQVRVKVLACGVCRTDLHVVDGELAHPKLPLVPGHEIVGRVDAVGPGVWDLALGERVGIPWLGHTCGACPTCRSGHENLCEQAGFTGYTLDGGYAEYAVAEAGYCFRLPPNLDDVAAAPLLCAGLIGHRALAMTGNADPLGFWGFGAAAHILAQVARAQGRTVYAFTRPGDVAAQTLALKLGCAGAYDAGTPPPEPLGAAIVFAPVGALIPEALARVKPAGVVVCAGIHMSDVPAFPYALLWGERVLRSVANLTRRDGDEFMALAAKIPLHMETTAYALSDANQALSDLRDGRLTGAAVLVP